MNKKTDLFNSLHELFELASGVERYGEQNAGSITEIYEKKIPIENGTVTVCVRYDKVPSNKLNDSFNLIHECFNGFYREFFLKISTDFTEDSTEGRD